MGFLPTGKRNSIADVARVTVGHKTIIKGSDIRTGVTVIDPGVKDLFSKKLPAAVCVVNGFGKVAGTTQIEEMGTIETPIALTNTLAVGSVMRGIIDIVLKENKSLKSYETINAVVGETNDGRVNAVQKDVVSKEDVFDAYNDRKKDFERGSVGAGTGTRAFAWKGGIGTSSRLIKIGKNTYTLGVLIQTNYGGSLSILGVPIGEIMDKNDFRKPVKKKPDGSCIIILATDAPVCASELKRIAKRAFFGVVRTGGIAASGSGDYVIAFSTNRSSGKISEAEMNDLFLAAVEATEESVYDAIFSAETVKGIGGNILQALPKEETIKMIMIKVALRR